jgi:taurine dioxygenase
MASTRLTIAPLDPVGAEVSSYLDGEIGREATEALYAAWLEYGILLFRDVGSAAQHLAISRCFGELEVHPLPELRAKEDPHFFPLGGPGGLASVFDEADVRVGRIPWHRDTAFRPDICKGAMLRLLEVPAEEGETLLADTAAAYDALPAEMQRRLDGLEYRAVISHGVYDYSGPGNWWKTHRLARDDEYPQGVEPPRDLKWPDKSPFPPVAYPAVLTHPESGRKCLFLSPMNIDGFLGLAPEESRQLTECLVAHMTSPRFVYKHRWSANDAIIWDNRRFLHAAAGNRPEQPRRGLRTTLADKLHVGRYFEGEAARSRSAPAA